VHLSLLYSFFFLFLPMEDKPSYPRLYHPDQRRVSSIMNNDPHPPAGVTASFSPYWNQTPLQQNLRYGQPPLDQSHFPRLSIAERFMAAGESDAHTIPTINNCNKKLAHTDKANDMVHDDRRPHHHQSLPFGKSCPLFPFHFTYAFNTP
jgi:hypothetical protein